MRRVTLAAIAVAAVTLAAPALRAQEEATPPLPHQSWSFEGPFGTFDRAALQRGFQVYDQVCSNCHSMNLLAYHDLSGIGFSENEIKAIAAQKQVTDGPNDQGDMYQRPGRPSDHFVPPFPNDQASRAAHNGALPPDLSVITYAREGGPDYVYALLTGFSDPPPGFKLRPNLNYDKYFPGHQIAMPPPLSDDIVTYSDGTKATVAQEAHDVVTFLAWAADPHTEDRKRTGAKVIIFLLVMTGILYAAKRKIWAEVH
jgi:ubiquinol-cytochrome c reductase cytochrome c1 subunit